MIDRLNLIKQYEALPTASLLLEKESVPTSGEETQTLGIVKTHLSPSVLYTSVYENQMGPLNLLQRLPGELNIFHGGDLSYVGTHWTFDVNRALDFAKSGSGGEKRECPTVRTINLGQLLSELRDACTQRGVNYVDFHDCIGPGTTWKSWEINFGKLEKMGVVPKTDAFKVK